MKLRFALTGWVLAAALATIAIATPGYAASDRTYATANPGWGNVIVVTYSDTTQHFDIAPLALRDEQPPPLIDRGYTLFKLFATKMRASGSAVLATTQAGWRSGRLRSLSGG